MALDPYMLQAARARQAAGLEVPPGYLDATGAEYVPDMSAAVPGAAFGGDPNAYPASLPVGNPYDPDAVAALTPDDLGSAALPGESVFIGQASMMPPPSSPGASVAPAGPAAAMPPQRPAAPPPKSAGRAAQPATPEPVDPGAAAKQADAALAGQAAAAGKQAAVQGAIGDEKALAVQDTQSKTAELGAKFQAQLDESRLQMAEADKNIKEAQAELKAMGPLTDRRTVGQKVLGLIALDMAGAGDIVNAFFGNKSEYGEKALGQINAFIEQDLQKQLADRKNKQGEISGMMDRYNMLRDKMQSDGAAYQMLRAQAAEELQLSMQNADLSHASEQAQATRDAFVAGLEAVKADAREKIAQDQAEGARQRQNAIKLANIHEGAATQRQREGQTFAAAQNAEDRALKELELGFKSAGKNPAVGSRIPGGGIVADAQVYAQTSDAERNDFVKKTQARQNLVKLAEEYAGALAKRDWGDRIQDVTFFGMNPSKSTRQLEQIRKDIVMAQNHAAGLGAYDAGTASLLDELTGASFFNSRTNEAIQNLAKRNAQAANLDARTIGVRLDPSVVPGLSKQAASVDPRLKAK